MAGTPTKKKKSLPSKQIRVTAKQYGILSDLSDILGVSRVEILSNAIGLAKILVDSKATAVKAICKNGEEKELLLTLLVGQSDED